VSVAFDITTHEKLVATGDLMYVQWLP